MAQDSIDNLLEQGIAALKARQKNQARQLLSQVVEMDEHNEMAWLWISGAVDTDAERRICLENVLAINPNNGIAKRGLERMGITQRISPFSTILPLSSSTTETAPDGEHTIQSLTPASAPAETERKEEEKEERKSTPPPRRAAKRRPTLLLVGAGVLVVACIVVVGIWWASSSGLLTQTPLSTQVATVTLGQTATTTGVDSVTSPAQSTWTPRPTNEPPTRLPTRTPRPTNTPLLTWTPSLTPTATLTGAVAATPTPAITQPPTWTPQPTSTLASTITRPPTWTPIATLVIPPTWTPNPTIVIPATWTPAYATRTPAITITLTSTLTTSTPGE